MMLSVWGREKGEGREREGGGGGGGEREREIEREREREREGNLNNITRWIYTPRATGPRLCKSHRDQHSDINNLYRGHVLIR